MIEGHDRSYALNTVLDGGPPLDDFKEPANLIYLAEVADNRADDHYHPIKGERIVREELQPNRHGDGSNYLFLDAHVKWYKIDSTLHPVNLHLTPELRDLVDQMTNPG
jgi:prepilin-type processing-associated H-X9-DG protein